MKEQKVFVRNDYRFALLSIIILIFLSGYFGSHSIKIGVVLSLILVILIFVVALIPSSYIISEIAISKIGRFGRKRKIYNWENAKKIEEIVINDFSNHSKYTKVLGVLGVVFIRPKQNALLLVFDGDEKIELLENRVKDYHRICTLIKQYYN